MRVKLVVAAALALAAGHAAAQPVDHAALGARYFAEGKLDDALRELEAAYLEEPDPNLLFALGRVHTARGDCVRAVDHYQRYLASQPGHKGADAAQVEIEKCAQTAPIDATPSGPGSGETALRPDPIDGGRRAPPRSFAGAMIRDRFVQAGLVTGVVAAGTFVYALQVACWDGVCEGGSYDDFLDRRDRAPRIAVTATVLGVAAAALVVTGVIRYTLRDDEDTRLEASLAPATDGGAVVVSGRF